MPGSSGVGLPLPDPAGSAALLTSASEFCHIIKDVSEYLVIPPWVAGHAMIYCHIYFSTHDPEYNDCLAVAIAALFLACKVPELAGSSVHAEGNDPLMADFDRGHLAVVVRACLEWVAFHEHQRSLTNGRPQVKINIPRQERPMKERVLAAERAILMDLGYQFVDYPLHGDVYQQCQQLRMSAELTQAAWNVANDSFMSPIVLQTDCADMSWAVIATAAWLLGQEDSLRNTNGAFIWENQGLDASVIEGIVQSLKGLYATSE